jgi:hypothetical protein
MNRMARLGCALLLGCSIAGSALAATDRSPMQVALTAKQASSGATETSPIAGSQDRSFALRIEDGRAPGAGQQIGEALDDGTPVFPIIATGNPAKFVEDVTRSVFATWGLHLGDPTSGTLALRFSKLNVAHNNRAVGATYIGDVTIDYTLLNRQGRVAAKGSFSGNVDHYGKGRSVENVNEALNEALGGALAQMLADAEFRKAWATAHDAPVEAEPAQAASAPRESKAKPERKENASTRSLEQRLRTLKTLLDNGTITQDEYDKRRAALLEEI